MSNGQKARGHAADAEADAPARPARRSAKLAEVDAGTDGNKRRDIAGANLRPLLFAWYRDLSALRYDYPLVLTRENSDAGYVRSLSSIVNGILRDVAPRGLRGERLRRHGLRLESDIRAAVAKGGAGQLSRLWRDAADRLRSAAKGKEQQEAVKDSLDRLDAARHIDGEVIDCDTDTPVRLLTRAWSAAQDVRTQEFRNDIAALARQLSDILRMDSLNSDDGRSPSALRQSVGTTHRAAFDFEAMARILAGRHTEGRLPARRRRRIQAALSTLRGQRFFPPPAGLGAAGKDAAPLSFVFDSCSAALAAFEERLSAMVALVKAMSVADLEIANRYSEAHHDPFFKHFDESSLTAADLSLFADYLIVLRGRKLCPEELMKALEILSSGLPMKILVQWDDILEDVAMAPLGIAPSGIKSRHFARMALSVGGAFVIQSSASHLYQLRHKLFAALSGAEPALISVFSGAVPAVSGVPPYLIAAAAMESRAFPAFVFDPSAGGDWASRFSVDDNPQPERDWPLHEVDVEDGSLQRATERAAFTLADFIACDPRFAKRFTLAPAVVEKRPMVAVADHLAPASAATAGAVPGIAMVDEKNALHRVAVDGPLVDATRVCRNAWLSLRELGGIDNSHVRRRIEQETARERDASRDGAPAGAPETADKTPAAAGNAGPAGIEEDGAAGATDQPYIETPRCATCNECTQINNRMFVYNENKQAYIADPDAGTFRQLVEAAERCQVAIVHPGKPRNPDEPGLEDLLQRAAAFA